MIISLRLPAHPSVTGWTDARFVASLTRAEPEFRLG
jgi:hypothetical protein